MVGLTGIAAADADAFRERHGVTYPIYAHAGEQFEALSIRFVPEVFLVGPDGMIAADGLGAARTRLEAEFSG